MAGTCRILQLSVLATMGIAGQCSRSSGRNCSTPLASVSTPVVQNPVSSGRRKWAGRSSDGMNIRTGWALAVKKRVGHMLPGVQPGGLLARICVTSPIANSSLTLGWIRICPVSATMLSMDHGFTPSAMHLICSRSRNATCLASGGASSSVWSLSPGRDPMNPILRMCFSVWNVLGLPRPRKSGTNLDASAIIAYMYTHRSGPMWHCLNRCGPCSFRMRLAIL
jgi:hypothetical protein